MKIPNSAPPPKYKNLQNGQMKARTWPYPISFGHFGSDLHFSVFEVEGLVASESCGLYWVYDMFRRALPTTSPELVACAHWIWLPSFAWQKKKTKIMQGFIKPNNYTPLDDRFTFIYFSIVYTAVKWPLLLRYIADTALNTNQSINQSVVLRPMRYFVFYNMETQLFTDEGIYIRISFLFFFCLSDQLGSSVLRTLGDGYKRIHCKKILLGWVNRITSMLYKY